MNRTRKYCVYRDCTTNSHNNPDLTLFQFPKNEERAAKWCELGAVDPFDNRSRFMCELHFPRIYMCFSARRKMLLNMAVPRAFGTNEEDDTDQDVLQSSSCDADISIEEHLDENIMDESDELSTEIIYMDQPDLESDENELPSTKKRFLSIDNTKSVQKIKLEDLSSPSRSVVVSSSSIKSAIESQNSIALRPTQATILRKVKLKKRPSTTKPIAIKASNLMLQEVSSSPMKKINATDSDKKKSEERVSSMEAAYTVGSSSLDNAVKNAETEKADKKHQQSSPNKREEPIYEFIFKGEEYVQMPKAKYYDERKELERKLEQSVKQEQRLKKKIEYYRHSLNDLKVFLNKLSEENDDDD